MRTFARLGMIFPNNKYYVYYDSQEKPLCYFDQQYLEQHNQTVKDLKFKLITGKQLLKECHGTTNI